MKKEDKDTIQDLIRNSVISIFYIIKNLWKKENISNSEYILISSYLKKIEKACKNLAKIK